MTAPAHPTRRARRLAEAAAASQTAGVVAVPPSTTTPVPSRPSTVTSRSATVGTTTGAVVAPPTAPVSTPGTSAAPVGAPALPSQREHGARAAPAGTRALPSRRELRAERSHRVRRPFRRISRPATASTAIRPVRPVDGSAWTGRTLPSTAAALAACLFVTVSTPGSAAAVPRPEARAAPDAQEFVVASGQVVPVTRDDFSVQDDFSGDPRTGTGIETVRPVAGTIPTAGGFGSRHVPGCAACSTDHHGLDFAAPYGQPVLAAMPGVVVEAAPLGGYGNQILLAHPDGSRSRYGHLSRIDVRVGQRVDAGQLIGAVGSTGVSTGPHLHFEVILGSTAVDPAPWLATRGLL